MADLFISYSRKDIAYARLLHKALSEHDLEAWVDWQDIPPSTEWLQEVYTAIEAAHTFIFLLSDSSTISEICSLEIEHAKKNNKRIIPIVINEVEPSKVHPALTAINWIFSRTQDELQPAISALIEAIQTDYDWVKAHTRLQVRALEWERAGQDKSFLLQGTDLRQAEDWLAEAPGKKLEPSLLQSRYIQSSRQAAARRQRSLLTGVGIALVVTILLSIFAFIQKGIAVEQARLARVRELTAVSQLPGTRFDIALLLGAETYNAVDNYQTRSNLLRLTQQHPQVIRMIAHEGQRKLSLSPDGKILAASWGGETKCWDTNTFYKLEPQEGWVNSTAFSPDGRILAFQEGDGSIILRDSSSNQTIGQPLQGFFPTEEDINSIDFSPDGRILAYSSGDDEAQSTILLWDTAAGQLIGELDPGGGRVHALAFSPDGDLLASAGGSDRIIFWDVTQLEPSFEIELEEKLGIVSLAFSPDGEILAAASRNRTITMYDVRTGARVGEPLAVHSGVVRDIVFISNGDTLVSTSLDGTIIFWNVSGITLNSGPLLGEFAYSGNNNLAFNPDTKTLASAASDEIILWDVANRQPLEERLDGSNTAVYGLAFSPDGEILASAGDDGVLTLWDLSTAQPRFKPWLAGRTENVYLTNNLAFSPDGKFLAHVSGIENRIISFWDTSNGNQIGKSLMKENYRYNQCIAFSPDGSLLAAGGEGETMLWDLATGKPIAFLEEHVGWVGSLAFSPDGAVLASGAEDGIILWDLASLQPLGDTLREHQTPVNRLAFSPDGSLLASASQDGAVILWDVASRLPLGEPLVSANASGTREPIIAFSPDGKSLISLHEDGILSTWDVDVESWRQSTCERVGRNFTQAEWAEYFPDEPYRKTCPQWPEGN